MQFHIEKYTEARKEMWNAFVKNSKNATFLLQRDFMEYHKDRFEDYSLLVFQDNKLVAVLPANKAGNALYSHQGLTYGGFVFNENEKVAIIKAVLEEIFQFLKQNGFKEMQLKLLPSIYNPNKSSAVQYFLFQKKAALIRRDMNFAVNLQQNIKVHKKKKKILQKDYVKALQIIEETNYNGFWEQVLKPVLKNRFDAVPVHTSTEIEELAKNFPENIKQYNVYLEQEIIAGMTLFIDNGVVKSQYGAVTESGKPFRALDFLYLFLFKKFKTEGYSYFDLGITNEADGYIYNEGLTNYKEELGGLPVNQDRYLLKL